MEKTTPAAAKAQGIPADLLKQAAVIPKGVNTEAFNPMEDVPTLAVGEDFEKGMTIGGYFEETQLIESDKFKFSNVKGPNGKPGQYRHVLRVGSPTGKRIAIWSTGELRNTFSKLSPGDYIAVKYTGKGENANKQQQHFFEYQRAAGQAPELNS